MHRSALSAAWVLTVAVLTTGCGTSSEPNEEPTVSSPPSSAPSSEPTSSTSDNADAAVADLADRLDIDPATVEVVAEEAVTWRDGSLGCAEPGVSYTQALVEGSRITLRADGTDYEYHSGGSQKPFWCEDPTQ